MDPLRANEAQYRLQHRHKDGAWADMVEVRSHHDPASRDPERSWILGKIFSCSSCPESVTLMPEAEGGGPEPR